MLGKFRLVDYMTTLDAWDVLGLLAGLAATVLFVVIF